MIGIEHFERVSKTLANITIKGSTLRLPIGAMDSYKKLRKRFMDEGIALPPEVRQPEWYALFIHLLESHPVPEQATAPMSSVSILVEYLNAHIGERLVGTRLNTEVTAQNGRPITRYEKDTHMIWVSREHIRTYLHTNGINYKSTCDDLRTRGVLLGEKVRRVLTAGTNFGGGPIVCWMIRADHPELGALISEHP